MPQIYWPPRSFVRRPVRPTTSGTQQTVCHTMAAAESGCGTTTTEPSHPISEPSGTLRCQYTRRLPSTLRQRRTPGRTANRLRGPKALHSCPSHSHPHHHQYHQRFTWANNTHTAATAGAYVPRRAGRRPTHDNPLARRRTNRMHCKCTAPGAWRG